MIRTISRVTMEWAEEAALKSVNRILFDNNPLLNTSHKLLYGCCCPLLTGWLRVNVNEVVSRHHIRWMDGNVLQSDTDHRGRFHSFVRSLKWGRRWHWVIASLVAVGSWQRRRRRDRHRWGRRRPITLSQALVSSPGGDQSVTSILIAVGWLGQEAGIDKARKPKETKEGKVLRREGKGYVDHAP